MKNFKIIYPRDFSLNSCVYFVIYDITLTYKICKYFYFDGFFLTNLEGYNDLVFKMLDINPSVFIKKCFNMKCHGIWPTVYSLELLKKQLKYLEYYDEI